MSNVTVNEAQRLYVIPAGGGYSCLGFEVVRDGANHMLELLREHETRREAATNTGALHDGLRVGDDELGSMTAYEKYLQVHALWRSSRVCEQTYFGPGTAQAVVKILERYRKDGDRQLRLWLGDPATGRDWCEEHDVVGRIGRSMGPMRVPLLIAPGEYGGGAILTHCIVRLMDVATGKELYRVATYQPPRLVVCADQRPGHMAWAVEHDGQVQAGFEHEADAHAYVAFMHGAVQEPYYLKR
jgi:hypothetical protein